MLLFHERLLAALLEASSCTTVSRPSVSTQQRGSKPPLPPAGISWSPRVAAPRPWEQRCGNSSARFWKYIHLNQYVSGSVAKNHLWKKSLTCVERTKASQILIHWQIISKLNLRYSHYHSLIPLNAELNPICHLLALLGGTTIVVVSRLRVKTRKFQSVFCISVSFI